MGALHTDRQLGWLMALGSLVLVPGQAYPWFKAAPEFDPWWTAGGCLVLATVACFAILGKRLPFTVLRAGWVAAPGLAIVLQLTTFAAYHGPDPDLVLPWVWSLEPVLVSFLTLWLRPLAAVGCQLLSAVSPVVSGLVFLGGVPQSVIENTPAHLSNIGFVAIFIAIRAGLTQIRAAEAEAAASDRARAVAEATAKRQESFGRLVHDELLSVLTAAFAFTDTAPPELRREAANALALLEDAVTESADSGPVDATEALARLVGIVERIDPQCRIRSDSLPGSVPAAVVDAVALATAESLRNSLRHAGPGTIRTVVFELGHDRITAVIRDDGCGFDLASVPPQRLGVTGSVLARMRAIEGGSAEISSGPGLGTTVELAWHR